MSVDPVQVDKYLDAFGLSCPLPLLKMKLALNDMEAGQVLEVIASDAGAEKDFTSFCEMTDNVLLSFTQDDEKLVFLIEKQA